MLFCTILANRAIPIIHNVVSLRKKATLAWKIVHSILFSACRRFFLPPQRTVKSCATSSCVFESFWRHQSIASLIYCTAQNHKSLACISMHYHKTSTQVQITFGVSTTCITLDYILDYFLWLACPPPAHELRFHRRLLVQMVPLQCKL